VVGFCTLWRADGAVIPGLFGSSVVQKSGTFGNGLGVYVTRLIGGPIALCGDVGALG